MLSINPVTAGLLVEARDLRTYLPRHPALNAESARLVADGKLALPSAPVFKAADFPEALAYLGKNGKVLLDFNPNRS